MEGPALACQRAATARSRRRPYGPTSRVTSDGVRADLGGDLGTTCGRVTGPDDEPSADAPQLLIQGPQAAQQVPGPVGRWPATLEERPGRARTGRPRGRHSRWRPRAPGGHGSAGRAGTRRSRCPSGARPCRETSCAHGTCRLGRVADPSRIRGPRLARWSTPIPDEHHAARRRAPRRRGPAATAARASTMRARMAVLTGYSDDSTTEIASVVSERDSTKNRLPPVSPIADATTSGRTARVPAVPTAPGPAPPAADSESDDAPARRSATWPASTTARRRADAPGRHPGRSRRSPGPRTATSPHSGEPSRSVSVTAGQVHRRRDRCPVGHRDRDDRAEGQQHPQHARGAPAGRRAAMPTSAGTAAAMTAVSGATSPMVPRDSARNRPARPTRPLVPAAARPEQRAVAWRPARRTRRP